MVSRPYSEHSKYDFILDAEGNLWRVQVKSSTTFRGGKYVVSLCRDGYTPAQIDVLAVLIVPTDTWYIIPAEEVSRLEQIRVMGKRTRGRGGLERFFERWRLLGERELPRSSLMRLQQRLDECLAEAT
jgi:hypothetical protein